MTAQRKKFPSSIYIGPVKITVSVVPKLGDQGEWDSDEREIKVREGGDYVALLHEVIHAISELYGVGIKEKRVRTLEMSLGGFLAENTWLIEGLKRRP